jgi:hypothetical protein
VTVVGWVAITVVGVVDAVAVVVVGEVAGARGAGGAPSTFKAAVTARLVRKLTILSLIILSLI